MPNSASDDLLAKLAGLGGTGDGANPWETIRPSSPEHGQRAGARIELEGDEDDPARGGDNALDQMCQRISTLIDQTGATSGEADDFVPVEPDSLADADLTDTQVESLILKFLFNTGEATGRVIADQTRLPFKLIEALLRQMKHDQLVVYKGAAQMNDYNYTITDMGRERGRREFEHCTYFGAAPVSLEDYIASIKAQSIEHQRCNVDDLRRAFADLLLSQRMLNRLGPAVNSGRGLFLYGAPGNGKTSIAERITKAFGQTIWIPRAVGIDGDIMRLFDPSNHEEMPLEASDGLLDQRRIDKRWVRIRRPTIVVGGELRMENLEITLNSNTNISEAPLQMKSNCGVLVIDDFGRQRIRTDELLNRWIVPLEKRYDFLNLASGKKIQVPFDQLIIFSTNLEPKDLVDDAFLRRIPYKIDVQDPSEEQFRELFQLMAPKLGFVYREDPVDYLIEKHYHANKRPFRCCQPRDLLLQVKNFCSYQGQSPEMTRENFDFAVENYFAIM
ncbi:MAG: AAA family ATPase [Pirellulales bacterium]